MDIWECPTCGLKGDYDIGKDEENFCPLCGFPEEHHYLVANRFRALATIFEDKELVLDEWWYTALWDNVLFQNVMRGDRAVTRMLFEKKAI